MKNNLKPEQEARNLFFVGSEIAAIYIFPLKKLFWIVAPRQSNAKSIKQWKLSLTIFKLRYCFSAD